VQPGLEKITTALAILNDCGRFFSSAFHDRLKSNFDLSLIPPLVRKRERDRERGLSNELSAILQRNFLTQRTTP
jgi:hypothetical protein